MITPEMKKKKSSLMTDLLLIALPLLAIGIWMLIDTAGMEHLEMEKASVHFFKEIWGAAAGLTLIIFSLVFSAIAGVKYIRKTRTKPQTQLYKLFELAFGAWVYSLILYVIVIIQSIMSNSGLISEKFAFKQTSDIHLVFITVIIVVGILVLGLWLSGKLRKK